MHYSLLRTPTVYCRKVTNQPEAATGRTAGVLKIFGRLLSGKVFRQIVRANFPPNFHNVPPPPQKFLEKFMFLNRYFKASMGQ